MVSVKTWSEVAVHADVVQQKLNTVLAKLHWLVLCINSKDRFFKL
jgi:hypothetical protein